MSSSTKQTIIAILSFIFFITLVVVLYVDIERKKNSHTATQDHAASTQQPSPSTTTSNPNMTTSENSQKPSLLAQFGCIGCHSLDGGTSVGPSFKGIYNTKVVVTVDGIDKEVLRDDRYMKDAIVTPNQEIVKGYQAMMPSSEGILDDKQLQAVIEELKKI